MDIVPHGVQDPAQWRWENVMRRLGGGRVANPYPADVFPWWWRQIIAVDDYPYVGIYFQGDPDMPLPLGVAYGDIGNESQALFLIFLNYNFLCVFWYIDSKDMFWCDDT